MLTIILILTVVNTLALVGIAAGLIRVQIGAYRTKQKNGEQSTANYVSPAEWLKESHS